VERGSKVPHGVEVECAHETSRASPGTLSESNSDLAEKDQKQGPQGKKRPAHGDPQKPQKKSTRLWDRQMT
jgi:hypothetical protein